LFVILSSLCIIPDRMIGTLLFLSFIIYPLFKRDKIIVVPILLISIVFTFTLVSSSSYILPVISNVINSNATN
jgi:hypothetical protein